MRALPMLTLAVLSLILMYWVRLRVDAAWVPFRAGQMLLVAAPTLIARGLIATSDVRPWRRWTLAVIAAAFVVGIPTTAIDAYNAQDVDNRAVGPGFHWTLAVTPDQQHALDWIRRTTLPTAVVQMEPTVRDRDLSPGHWGEHWSLIPSFAERRMGAGMPISLMRIPEYGDRSQLVKAMYESADAREAWSIAHKLRIDYLYVDAIDRAAYPSVAKFDATPGLFTRVYASGEASVYQVK
jgi:hypothetical protein